MRVLLDTNVFLWWIGKDERLSPLAVATIESLDNDIYLSAVSVTELAIKSSIGRLRITGDLRQFIYQQVELQGFLPLDLTFEHAVSVESLPLLHRDPFDRLLVAQAKSEQIPILASDPAIAGYDLEVIW